MDIRMLLFSTPPILQILRKKAVVGDSVHDTWREFFWWLLRFVTFCILNLHSSFTSDILRLSWNNFFYFVQKTHSVVMIQNWNAKLWCVLELSDFADLHGDRCGGAAFEPSQSCAASAAEEAPDVTHWGLSNLKLPGIQNLQCMYQPWHASHTRPCKQIPGGT